MPFTPKFADLVRNFTTVQGTGPVTLGQAVSGYTGIAGALSQGDQFYYCLQSVDKPQEREVGRGTLLADGRIGRDPISGGLTNFTTGTKTIALVAAAEWFAKADQAGGGAAIEAASRSVLAASAAAGQARMLTEAGREGLFIFQPGNLSAKVALDTDQGLYVAPASDPSGASGAWMRKFEHAVHADWFGLAGDDTSDDGPKVQRILELLRAGRTGYHGAAALRFGPRKYFLGTSTLNLRSTLIVEGASRLGTQLRWAANCIGIIVQRINTADGLTGQSGSVAGGGDHSVIRHLTLKGGYVSDAATPEGAYHGIALRARGHLDDLTVTGFQGDGLYSSVAAGSPTNEGNANCAFITNCLFQLCRNGAYVDSADANAMTFVNCDASSNRQWGFWDSSFLGNCYTGCHTAANGWDGAINSLATACSHSGNRYAVVPGQEAWCSANPPTGSAASNQGWLFLGAGGSYHGVANWSNGTAFRTGGAFFLDGGGGNQCNVLTNCYAEADQNPSQAAGGTLFLQGQLARGVYSGINAYPGLLKGDGLSLRSNSDLQVGRDLDIARNLTGAGHALLQGAVTARGGGNLGPNNGTGIGSMTLNFGSADYFDMPFYSWAGGVNTEQGYFRAFSSGGIVANARVSQLQKIDGALIHMTDANGLNLEAGKSLYNNGQKVVGTRGPALPPDATDLASALALVNAIKARLKATGGHGLVAD